MIAALIHDPLRLDRAKFVGALYEKFPDIHLVVAQQPAWETDPHNRALRGCMLSHLLAIKEISRLRPDENILVLEDDAELYAPGWAEWVRSQGDVPEDAGIVLLGSETETHGPSVNGFIEVLPKCFGSHAVIYTPQLIKRGFLQEAYAITAANRIGRSENGAPSLCPESVMLMATGNVGLKVYRPRTMAFTAAPGFSSRESADVPARTANMVVDSPRKVVASLNCGLGNQMFQIAAAAALAKRYGLGWVAAPVKNYHLPQGRRAVTYLNTLFRGLPLRPQTAGAPTIKEAGFQFAPIEVPAGNDDVTMLGWYQSAKYHEGIDVKRLFDLSWYDPATLIELRQRFDKPLCAVHFRGGDFVGDSLRGICGASYYAPIIAEMRKTHAIILVTDDPKQAALEIPDADYLLTGGQDFEDLAFMSRTDALIMGNSTFAWWAAALGNHNQVHAPDRWFTDPAISSSDIPKSGWSLHPVPAMLPTT